MTIFPQGQSLQREPTKIGFPPSIQNPLEQTTFPFQTSVCPSFQRRELYFNVFRRVFYETLSLRNTQEEGCAQITLRNAASHPHLLHIHKTQQHINLRNLSANHLFNFSTEYPKLMSPRNSPPCYHPWSMCSPEEPLTR